MIAVLKHGTTQEQTQHLIAWLRNMNLDVHVSQGQDITILGLIGDTSRVDMDLLGSLDKGVVLFHGKASFCGIITVFGDFKKRAAGN